jgi:hypothetical protein
MYNISLFGIVTMNHPCTTNISNKKTFKQKVDSIMKVKQEWEWLRGWEGTTLNREDAFIQCSFTLFMGKCEAWGEETKMVAATFPCPGWLMKHKMLQEYSLSHSSCWCCGWKVDQDAVWFSWMAQVESDNVVARAASQASAKTYRVFTISLVPGLAHQHHSEGH